MRNSFVHLHTHTEYSILDGAAKISPLFEEVKRLGMQAVAMTDHGNMFGASEFYNAAKKFDIKPIIGIEAYVAPGSRFDTNKILWGRPEQKRDDVSGGGAYTHMTMIAETEKGLRNLFKLSSLASYEGQLGKWPRMDLDLIASHSEGIIATTGCPSGEIQTRLRLGQFEEALSAAATWQDVYGAENFYLELMEHGLEIEKRVRDDLLKIGKLLNLPPLATNDSHYVTHDDATNHEALLCVQTGKTLSDPTRFRLDGSGYYIKSPQEMRSIWAELPQACDNTELIAERVQSYDKVWEYRNRMPLFPVPAGFTQESWLEKEAFEGLSTRLTSDIPGEYIDRLKYELKIINDMGFASYFLVVADLIKYANKVGIKVGPGRGSAAGSLVAYALRIISIDPIQHGLFFERFLNPERISMPDIDMDFDDRRRGEMVRYAMERWGEDYVAQVITFGKIKTKAAIKDAARVNFGQPGYNIADKISKSLPPAVMAKDISLAGIFNKQDERYKEAAQVRELIETEPDCKTIYDTALGLEGLTRNVGVHACAVILSSEPLLDVIPLWKRPNDGAIITGWDYPSCENIGLLKMDFLGLRNLTVIGDTLENIKNNKGLEIDLDTLPLDNEEAYKLLSRGDTLGVFQMDSGPIRDLLRRMQPTSFNDIVATVALYRPGPMGMNAHNDYADRKNGRQKIKPIHPELEDPLRDILSETYGLIVYQEQIMSIAQKVAGYSLGRADILRRAMGKKKAEVLSAEFEGFEAGMKSNGFSAGAIKALWEAILPFAGYAFNKSHAAGYALVSYWTAYLKANYTSEYMAGLLTSVADDKDKSALYLADCRHLNVTVLPPDINESEKKFTTVGENIKFALSAIRNVGSAVVDSIIDTRNQKGKFKDFYDFLQKNKSIVCTKKVIESLIKSGAFDSLQHPRKGLFLSFPEVLEAAIGSKKAEEIGQFDLFGQDETVNSSFTEVFNTKIPEVEWDKKELLALERQMLGLYVSDHPLREVAEIINSQSDCTIPSIVSGELKDGAAVKVGGILTNVTRKVNKNGVSYAVAQLEDLAGGIEVYFFPKTYQVYAEDIVQDAIVLVSARVNVRDDKTVLIANSIGMPNFNLKVDKGTEKVVLKVDVKLCTDSNISNLKQILAKNPGSSPVELHILEDGMETSLQIANEFMVQKNVEFVSEVKALFGAASI